MKKTFGEWANLLWPYLQPKVAGMVGAATIRRSVAPAEGSAPSPHDLNSAHHTGTMADSQAPQFLKTDGTRQLTGNMFVSPGVTVDGVDISGHAVDPDAHHIRATAGDGISVASQVVSVDATVVRTSRVLTAGNGLTGGGDLSADRTFNVGAGLGITVNANDVALTTPGTLSVSTGNNSTGSHTHTVTSSSNPGAATSLLASDASGYLTLVRLTTTDRVRTPLIGTASGALTLQPTTDVVLDPDSNLTKFVDSSAIQTNSFTSGFAGAGLRIDQGISRASKTTVETDDIYVRGRMHVYELLIHQIRATNGSVFVSSTGKAVSVSSLGGGFYRVNTDPETAHGFAVNDVIRAQRFTGTGVYQCNMVVSAVASTSQFDALLASGDAPAAGMEFVRLGNTSDTSRQGALYLTADDSGAPFIDVVDGILSESDWNTAGKVKVRVGKLTGITGTANEYGLYAQSGSGTYSASRLKASTQGVELQNANLYVYDGSGSNQGKWTYTGIEFPLLTSAFKSLSWTLAAEAESSAAVRGAALSGEMHLDLLGGLGPSRTDGYVTMNMSGHDAGPVLGEISYVRAGVRRVSSTARSYTALMSSQKNFLLGPATVVSADTSNVTDPTTTRNGLYLTNAWSSLAGTNNSEIANDTNVYKSLMLVGNTKAGGTRRVSIYDVLSINGAAYNESALNVSGTTELNGATSRTLKLTNSSGGAFALEFYRSDQTKGVSMFNYDGDQLYADGPLMLVESSAANDANQRMLYLSAGADGTLGGLTFGVWLRPSATGGNRKIHMGGGDASAMRSLILGSNAAGSYSNIGIGTDSPQRKLHVAGTVIVDGDEGGIASTIGFTDVFNSAGGAGVGTIAMNGATNQVNTQWIKIYIGTTAHYIPCWSSI